MKTLSITIILLFISLNGISQSFKLTDSSFQVGDIYKINNLRLGYDGDRLDDESKAILDSIVIFFKNNPRVQVEFGTYSDLRGNADSNLMFSQLNAEYYVNYLITKGANEEQVIAKGYGELEPEISEEEINNYRLTDKREYERLHLLNRRNILRIIKIDTL